jgi:GxxExxY protein
MLYGDSEDNETTDRIIACAMEVHRHLGPGLLESTYESALCLELSAAELRYRRQVAVPLFYKGRLLSEHRPDLIVAERVVVEIKSTERFHPVYTAQMLTYLRITDLQIGLILNFNTAWLKQGIRRVMR